MDLDDPCARDGGFDGLDRAGHGLGELGGFAIARSCSRLPLY
jgi:hypothetical protein